MEEVGSAGWLLLFSFVGVLGTSGITMVEIVLFVFFPMFMSFLVGGLFLIARWVF